MCQVTAIPIKNNMACMRIFPFSKVMLMRSVSQSVVVDMILIRRGSAFSSWKARMYDPSFG